ncbi:hypothetical protein DdX_20354 [Ditylenchus destructor]|uniref:Uncharacterized protein n=1 Tax=Ditylenchus destructor TaxID=166010 RepID=A0AAD4MIU6_9BILA|nr:hypothetical protein DdX_20354 [Ditylenchus destructor]
MAILVREPVKPSSPPTLPLVLLFGSALALQQPSNDEAVGNNRMELSAECYLASSLKEPTYHIHSSWLRTAYKATKFSPSGTTNNTKRCPQPTSSV